MRPSIFHGENPCVRAKTLEPQILETISSAFISLGHPIAPSHLILSLSYRVTYLCAGEPLLRTHNASVQEEGTPQARRPGSLLRPRSSRFFAVSSVSEETQGSFPDCIMSRAATDNIIFRSMAPALRSLARNPPAPSPNSSEPLRLNQVTMRTKSYLEAILSIPSSPTFKSRKKLSPPGPNIQTR